MSDTIRPLTLWDTSDAAGDEAFAAFRLLEPGFEKNTQSVAVRNDPSCLSCRYVQVLVNLSTSGLQERIFTYRASESYAALARIGQPVRVPFGGQQDLTGVIIGLSDEYHGPHALRDIAEILDEEPLFDSEYFDFLSWVADYYATTLPQVLACALPSGLAQRVRKKVFPGKAGSGSANGLKPGELQAASRLLTFLSGNSKGYSPQYLAGHLQIPLKKLNPLLARLKTSGAVRIESERADRAQFKTVRWVWLNPQTPDETVLSGRHREIVALLGESPDGMPWRELLDKAKTTAPTLKKLTDLGFLRVEELPQTSSPLDCFDGLEIQRELRLSEHQQAAMETVLRGDAEHPYLLYGITGSGKTEVYIALTREMLVRGRSVLMMVPEIALTSQIARRFIGHFGKDGIAVWHSHLSEAEKTDAWRKLSQGELKVLIGARSAIWAPMKDLGLILIDEEHESSFKQDSPEPRYNAKTLAMERARRSGAKILLGSATPEIATYYEARLQERVLHLPERFGGSRLAEAHLVDMKAEYARGGRGQLSGVLMAELEINLKAGEQSIVMLNRRGFYTTIQCNVCDMIFQCASCDVALTYHRTGDRVCCHYCGFQGERPQYCPVCASMDLNSSGVGTQRVEAEIIRKFPEARVLRLDSDILRRKNAYAEIFETFAAGAADILIGTQIVAKGLDVANVTLVGVVSGDASFALPDYKSAERGFQLLTQVAGRAGRGRKPGRVIIQSIQPGHPVLRYAQKQDYTAFYQEEILQRETSGFPPFSRLYRLIASSENEERAKQFIETAAMRLTALLRAEDERPAEVLSKASDTPGATAINAEGAQESRPAFALMGPAPCVLPRIRNRYRFHLLIKSISDLSAHRRITEFYRKTMAGRLPEDLHFILDVDAQSLL